MICVCFFASNLSANAEILTKKMTSQIAGYYILNDNNVGNFNNTTPGYLRDLIQKYKNMYPKKYTWTGMDNYAVYSTEGIQFTQNTNLDITGYTGLYLHIAAVDVSGNIGDTTTIEIASTNLFRIVFNTNHLPYQIMPENTVDTGSYNASNKTQVSAPGQNIQGYYHAGYYSVEDSSMTGMGTFNGVNTMSYGGAFPIPTANGCVFVGWNSKADGSGVYYSADGSNIGNPNILDIKLTLSDKNFGQEIVLYAIWAEGAESKKDNDIVTEETKFNTSFQKNIETKTVVTRLNEDTGLTLSGSNLISDTETKLNDMDSWSSQAIVNSYINFPGTGTYGASQHLFDKYENYISSENVVVAGIQKYDGVVSKVSSGTPISLKSLLWNTGTDTRFNLITPAGVTELSDVYYISPYNTEKEISINYNIQGTYKIRASAISRTYMDTKPIKDTQGYTAFMYTDYVTIKVDKTPPTISHYEVTQDRLDKHDFSDIPNLIGKSFNTVFTATVSDYTDDTYGAYLDDKDASGLYGVYVNVYDPTKIGVNKTFKLNKYQQMDTTSEGEVIKGIYGLTVDLYSEFPESSLLIYKLYAVDNAGNASETMSHVETNGNTGLPTGDATGDTTNKTEWVGLLNNTSIATAIYSTVDDAYNVAPEIMEDPDNNIFRETYFKTGEVGRVEVWTIGYIDDISLDFGDIGKESMAEIVSGKLLPKYNLGVDKTVSSEYIRVLSNTIADVVYPEFFEVYDATTKTIKQITAISNEELYNSLLYNEKGTPYASHYVTEGWLSDGMSVRIPPYYALTQDGNKKKEDNTPQYLWEMHTYKVNGYKDGSSVTSESRYIIWDTQTTDVHFRITHES